jgi:hypothetical protein
MDDDDRAALWAAELEALAAVLPPDAALTIDRAAPPRVSLRVVPAGGGTPFVACTLVIDCGPRYPDDPPAVALADVKGLGDGRRDALLALLTAAAADAAGDCALALLADAAGDALAAAPAPDGDCPLCLRALADGGGDAAAPPRLVKLTCWHALHADCAGAWWRVVREREGGGDGVVCPSCRAVAGPLPAAAVAKLNALADKARSEGDEDALRRGGPAAWGLDAAATAALAAHRAAVAAGLATQAAAGGLTADRVAVTLEELAAMRV